MDFEEHAAKPLLAAAGIRTPKGRLALSAADAALAATELGVRAVVKAQVATGKRGKAGGIKVVASATEATAAAERILGLEIGGYPVQRLLVEEAADIAREFYAAVMNDATSKGPLLLFSTAGGMDIEEVFATRPETVRRQPIDIRAGLDARAAADILAGLDLDAGLRTRLGKILAALYRVYRTRDAELVEINPLALTRSGDLVALDCKFTLDDAAKGRQADIAKLGAPAPATALEQRGQEQGLYFIELDGDVGVLANGAGLTMTTMDAVRHYGGRAANFLEIGGQSYTKATAGLDLVLANPNVTSLVINFCGAFARTDVMAEGVVQAWKTLQPTLPVFFSIHGTGEKEAIALVRRELGFEPYDVMDDAVKAAVAAAKGATARGSRP
ncbi:MAG: succinate--CoA ligase [Alphaproteobacteria bacterium]|nr:succinate--CoA ligase [Alphaproteobacteria bacterium]